MGRGILGLGAAPRASADQSINITVVNRVIILQRAPASHAPLATAGAAARALSAVTKLSTNNCFGGQWRRFQFDSSTTGTPMVFSVFVPPVEKAPCLFYLSGLTCTDENFVQKAGAARRAAELGIALVAPDTSPRLPDDRKLPGEDDSYNSSSDDSGDYESSDDSSDSNEPQGCHLAAAGDSAEASDNPKQKAEAGLSGSNDTCSPNYINPKPPCVFKVFH